MDHNRFDALARLLAMPGSRRAALGALLGVGPLGRNPDVSAKGGKGGKGKDNGQGVQGEGRPRAKHKAHHKHKQTRRQRRQKRDRQDRGGGQQREVCCGATTRCAPPEPGSTRSRCDFARQSFAGQDLHGSIFRRIDGGGANFDNTDNHGSDFAAACLREATFRGAKLAGATWGGACLFAADFTGADLGDPDALGEAVLCATILPDGTRNDRDCDKSRTYSCCLPPPGGGGGGGGPIPCTKDTDCPAFLECGVGFCACTNHSCPGCCDEDQPTCYPGNTDEHCGHPPKHIPGNFCQACPADQRCIAGGCASR